MTTVNGDLVNVLGVKQDGVVRIASSLTRPDGSQVIVDDWDEVYVKAGKFTANVAGGPARFHVRAGSTSKIFNVVVPKTGTVSFASLLEDVVEWSPEIVSRAAMEARAAAESAKAAAKSASVAKAGADRVGTAEQVGKWASSAQSSATSAGKSATSAGDAATRAAGSESAAASSASAAKTDAGKAASSAKAAAGSADAAGASEKAAASSRSDASSFANSAKSASESATASEKAATESASAAKADAGKAATSATGASDSAKAAKADAGRAKSSADSASTSASAAKGSADAAKASADAASKSAAAAASSASAARTDAGKAATSATEASNSAKSAKADADRAVGVVDSVQWNDDKLTVAGKTSPSLRGPKGDPGDGTRGVAINGDGTDPQATGSKSLALGWGSQATGHYSAAIGYDAQARGSYNTAVGRDSLTRLSYSTAVGYGAKAEKTNSTAIGAEAVATEESQTRIGNPDSKYHVSLAGDVRLTQEPSRDDNAATKKYVDSAVQNNTTPPTWEKVEGKPSEFPPSAHKHTLADITNAPNSHTSAATANTLVSRDSGGRAQFATPTSTGHAANKAYVDGAVRDKADKSYVDSQDAEVRAFAQSRPAFFSGAGSPPSTIPGAVVGDYYLDETTMELHKITGV